MFFSYTHTVRLVRWNLSKTGYSRVEAGNVPGRALFDATQRVLPHPGALSGTQRGLGRDFSLQDFGDLGENVKARLEGVSLALQQEGPNTVKVQVQDLAP